MAVDGKGKVTIREYFTKEHAVTVTPEFRPVYVPLLQIECKQLWGNFTYRLESPQDPQLAVAIYGSNEYSYSVGDLLTTMCTQWVPCASVFTFYAPHSFPFQRVVDGGFSDNIPQPKDITVSPFSGDFDICLHGIGSLCVSFTLGRRTRAISVCIIYNFTSFSREECLPLVVVFTAKVAPSPWSKT